MRQWSITLHGPAGVIGSVDTAESQFVIGSETASDVFTVTGQGVSARHAWVWIGEMGLQVEDLDGGTLVNGYAITDRVQVEYPASVQVGEITLVIELKAMQPVGAHAPGSLDITIPQRAAMGSKSGMEVTIPQPTPTGTAAQTALTHGETVSADSAPLRGEYKLVHEIARGGMGQIYFGVDAQLKRNVAVKVSSVSEAGEDPRFSKEAEVLAQLAHPNIVPIHNIGVDAKGRPFYSMKLVKGRTLQAVLNLIRDGDAAEIKNYPHATLLTIFRKVCDAMMFAHSKGILHRDLKPENIMVGEYGEVLVMDWGLAKVLGEPEDGGFSSSRAIDTGDYGMTMEGEVMGTPQYMSPEQAQGMVAELDHRSDIYSLGGILYAILTLRPPIEGTTLDEVLTKVKSGDISSMATTRHAKSGVKVAPPSAMGAEVPEALQAVTLKAMSLSRNQRYASVEALAGDIERYQNGFATSAENAGAARQLVLFIRRNKALASAAALLVLAGIGFVVKLAASERRALSAMEESRREAAQAQIILAESTYDRGNGDQMRTALSKVPEDLRTQVWSYLNERLVGGDVSVLPEGDTTWMGIDPHPLQPGNFLALRSDGAFCLIEGSAGAVSVLWKVDQQTYAANRFSISRDGSLAAYLAKSTKAQSREEIQVRRVNDGELLRSCTLPEDHVMNPRLWVSSHHLLVQIQNIKKNRERCLAAFSLADGQLLWQTPPRPLPTFATFCDDPKEISCLTGDGLLQRLEVSSGKVLSQSKGRIGTFPNRYEVFDGTQDWKRFALGTGGPSQVRVFSDAWNDRMQTEFVSDTDVQAVAFLQASDFLLAIRAVSEHAGCLEIRDCSQGSKLLRSLPFTDSNVPWWNSYPLRCSGAYAAFLLPNRIRIWNCNETPPVRKHSQPSGEKFTYSFLSSSGTQVISLQTVSGANPKVAEICLLSIEGGLDAPRELGRLAISDEKTGKSPDIAWNSNTQLQFNGAGDRALLSNFRSALALDIGSGGLKNTWGVVKLLLPTYESGSNRMLLHPTSDLLWTGESVFEFSSGRELRRISRGQFKNYPGFRRTRPAAWISTDHMVEECLVGGNGPDFSDEAGANHIVLWDLNTGLPIANESSPYGRCVAVSPDGNCVAEGCVDMRVRFRNRSTLRADFEIRAHDSEVRDLEWHPSGLILATLSESEVRLWDVKTLRVLEEIRLKQSNRTVSFLSDGRQLKVGDLIFEPKSCGLAK